jgi:hypothetical protein
MRIFGGAGDGNRSLNILLRPDLEYVSQPIVEHDKRDENTRNVNALR